MLRLSRSTVKNEYCSQETDKAKKKKKKVTLVLLPHLILQKLQPQSVIRA